VNPPSARDATLELRRIKTHYNDECKEAGLQIGAWIENEKK
jgi:hypothetical protein